MTNKEKELIKKIINELMSENGNFSWGIGQLCKLVGLCYPSSKIKANKVMSLEEALKLPNQDFEIKKDKL